ncbi:uncharacterized protein LOC141642202 [Silene latifolia]|uniref:uncharacterized protein LOC141642202 n=1 Tax=Silene latifolia TaxID=37657 RepID=UPI003D7760C2
MELALSLGNNTRTTSVHHPVQSGFESGRTTSVVENNKSSVDFCMGLTPSSKSTAEINDHHDHDDDDHRKVGSSSSSDPTADISPRQLDLIPFSPIPRPCSSTLRLPWLSDNLSSEPGSSDGPGSRSRIMEVNRRHPVGPADGDADEDSSPNSGTSSFMEFSLYTRNNKINGRKKRENDYNNNNDGESKEGGGNYGQGVIEGGGGATTSRGSDDEENGSTRKKLRLSKEQSAFLEESFKEHHTLNPKQKQALAKELNLRPRQVEVWFQNRRARTKLKQTEVDCEYLKRCCETLTEENRRLQKELHELRALKSSQPFFMHHPATTLTMCPSCERVAPTSASAASTTVVSSIGTSTSVVKPNPGLALGNSPPQVDQNGS